MEDNPQGQDPNTPRNQESNKNSEPIRSRWTPKPEQILILESIFNSGMVNPSKDETVRIRKLLEKFGSVGDANVFYWFQNRRSRSRRRQRQMQAAGGGLAGESRNQAEGGGASASAQYDQSGQSGSSSSSSSICFTQSLLSFGSTSNPCSYGGGGSSSSASENFFALSDQMGFSEVHEQISVGSSILCSSETSSLHYQSGFITVFINGVQTEVPRGPLDMKAMFGQDHVVLVHSSGVPLPTNEFGYLMQSLQHGESYFLVSRPT